MVLFFLPVKHDLNEFSKQDCIDRLEFVCTEQQTAADVRRPCLFGFQEMIELFSKAEF